jgi:hypothetical protein
MALCTLQTRGSSASWLKSYNQCKKAGKTIRSQPWHRFRYLSVDPEKKQGGGTSTTIRERKNQEQPDTNQGESYENH